MTNETSDINIISVTQLNKYIKLLIDNNPTLSRVCVGGEISNCKIHSSGHIYMSLKDEGSVIRAIMFKGSASKLTFTPQTGQKVIAEGRISVFERDGQYQLYIDKMSLQGEGSLYIAFEALKKKLLAEGIFDESRKKRLPGIPKTIGVITSPTGAALRDIINITKRRCPLSRILIYPSLVQGPSAAAELARGVSYMNRHNLCDVIIIGRGGGSIEELWAFNDEALAREIYASSIPVVSAVGHETDFTICDFVADFRAPTPSAAAEKCTPDFPEIYRFLDKSNSAMESALKKKLDSQRKTLERLSQSGVLTNPVRLLSDKLMLVDHLGTRLEGVLNMELKKKRHIYDTLESKLSALDPRSVMSRGYSIVMTKDGNALRSAQDISKGDEVTIHSYSASAKALVTEVSPTDDFLFEGSK